MLLRTMQQVGARPRRISRPQTGRLWRCQLLCAGGAQVEPQEIFLRVRSDSVTALTMVRMLWGPSPSVIAQEVAIDIADAIDIPIVAHSQERGKPIMPTLFRKAVRRQPTRRDFPVVAHCLTPLRRWRLWGARQCTSQHFEISTGIAAVVVYILFIFSGELKSSPTPS